MSDINPDSIISSFANSELNQSQERDSSNIEGSKGRKSADKSRISNLSSIISDQISPRSPKHKNSSISYSSILSNQSDSDDGNSHNKGQEKSNASDLTGNNINIPASASSFLRKVGEFNSSSIDSELESDKSNESSGNLTMDDANKTPPLSEIITKKSSPKSQNSNSSIALSDSDDHEILSILSSSLKRTAGSSRDLPEEAFKPDAKTSTKNTSEGSSDSILSSYFESNSEEPKEEKSSSKNVHSIMSDSSFDDSPPVKEKVDPNDSNEGSLSNISEIISTSFAKSPRPNKKGDERIMDDKSDNASVNSFSGIQGNSILSDSFQSKKKTPAKPKTVADLSESSSSASNLSDDLSGIKSNSIISDSFAKSKRNSSTISDHESHFNTTDENNRTKDSQTRTSSIISGSFTNTAPLEDKNEIPKQPAKTYESSDGKTNSILSDSFAKTNPKNETGDDSILSNESSEDKANCILSSSFAQTAEKKQDQNSILSEESSEGKTNSILSDSFSKSTEKKQQKKNSILSDQSSEGKTNSILLDSFLATQKSHKNSILSDESSDVFKKPHKSDGSSDGRKSTKNKNNTTNSDEDNNKSKKNIKFKTPPPSKVDAKKVSPQSNSSGKSSNSPVSGMFIEDENGNIINGKKKHDTPKKDALHISSDSMSDFTIPDLKNKSRSPTGSSYSPESQKSNDVTANQSKDWSDILSSDNSLVDKESDKEKEKSFSDNQIKKPQKVSSYELSDKSEDTINSDDLLENLVSALSVHDSGFENIAKKISSPDSDDSSSNAILSNDSFFSNSIPETVDEVESKMKSKKQSPQNKKNTETKPKTNEKEKTKTKQKVTINHNENSKIKENEKQKDNKKKQSESDKASKNNILSDDSSFFEVNSEIISPMKSRRNSSASASKKSSASSKGSSDGSFSYDSNIMLTDKTKDNDVVSIQSSVAFSTTTENFDKTNKTDDQSDFVEFDSSAFSKSNTNTNIVGSTSFIDTESSAIDKKKNKVDTESDFIEIIDSSAFSQTPNKNIQTDSSFIDVESSTIKPSKASKPADVEYSSSFIDTIESSHSKSTKKSDDFESSFISVESEPKKTTNKTVDDTSSFIEFVNSESVDKKSSSDFASMVIESSQYAIDLTKNNKKNIASEGSDFIIEASKDIVNTTFSDDFESTKKTKNSFDSDEFGTWENSDFSHRAHTMKKNSDSDYDFESSQKDGKFNGVSVENDYVKVRRPVLSVQKIAALEIDNRKKAKKLSRNDEVQFTMPPAKEQQLSYVSAKTHILDPFVLSSSRVRDVNMQYRKVLESAAQRNSLLSQSIEAMLETRNARSAVPRSRGVTLKSVEDEIRERIKNKESKKGKFVY